MVSITFSTRGVKGADMLLKEFTARIEDELYNHLPAYAQDTTDKMKAEAPVDTGYMRDHIRFNYPTPKSVSINSWAPYSGYVNYGTFRMTGRPFFSRYVEAGPQTLRLIFQQASVNYLRHLINKYQNGP
jgi:hypothetical protein